MGFSDIAVEQRSQEAVALRSFLVYSLMGSLALHVGVLFSGIGNFLSRVPKTEDEPIELAIIETPKPQVTETPQAEIKPETSKIIEKSSFIPVAPNQQAVKVEEPRREVKNVPVQKIIPEVQKREPIRQKETVEINSPRKTDIASNQINKRSSTDNSPPATSMENTERLSDKLRERLRGFRDSQAGGGGGGGGGGSPILTGSGAGSGSGTGSGAGSGTGSGAGSGTGSGAGSGTGTGSGSGSGTGRGAEVATAPRNPVIEAPPAPVNRNDGNGRAACRECNAKYPEAARRRRVEGRVEVAVDTDDNGNVTNVRVARSSGDRELDEETARQARDWKLKPATGGRQGVSIATEFTIQGSRRHSEVQKRRQQREVEERNQPAAVNNTNSTAETPRVRPRSEASNNDNATDSVKEPQTRSRRSPTSSSETESRISRRLIAPRAETTSESRTSNSGGSLRESLRRTKRDNAVSNSSPQSQLTRKKRRRTDQARPASQTKLIESLRRSRQESPAAAPEAPATENSGN